MIESQISYPFLYFPRCILPLQKTKCIEFPTTIIPPPYSLYLHSSRNPRYLRKEQYFKLPLLPITHEKLFLYQFHLLLSAQYYLHNPIDISLLNFLQFLHTLPILLTVVLHLLPLNSDMPLNPPLLSSLDPQKVTPYTVVDSQQKCPPHHLLYIHLVLAQQKVLTLRLILNIVFYTIVLGSIHLLIPDRLLQPPPKCSMRHHHRSNAVPCPKLRGLWRHTLQHGTLLQEETGFLNLIIPPAHHHPPPPLNHQHRISPSKLLPQEGKFTHHRTEMRRRGVWLQNSHEGVRQIHYCSIVQHRLPLLLRHYFIVHQHQSWHLFHEEVTSAALVQGVAEQSQVLQGVRLRHANTTSVITVRFLRVLNRLQCSRRIRMWGYTLKLNPEGNSCRRLQERSIFITLVNFRRKKKSQGAILRQLRMSRRILCGSLSALSCTLLSLCIQLYYKQLQIVFLMSRSGFFWDSEQIVLVSVAVLSSLISLTLPYLYYIKKQCRSHPSVLIANISLLQSLSNYNVVLIAANVYRLQEYLDISYIFSFLTLGYYDTTLDDLCEVNLSIYICLQLLSLAYHLCYSLDLLLTLQHPFLSGRKRIRFYHIFTTLFAILGLLLSLPQAHHICQQQYHTRSILKVPLSFLAALLLFTTLSLFIITLSCRRPASTCTVRSTYISQHRCILFVLVLAWLPPIALNILILLGDEESPAFTVLNMLSFVSVLAITGIITLIRWAYDSFLFQAVKCMLLCRTNSPSPIADDRGEVWNLPLSEAVNQFRHQQIVECILQVIVEASVQSNNVGGGSILSSSLHTSVSEAVRAEECTEKQLKAISQDQRVVKVDLEGVVVETTAYGHRIFEAIRRMDGWGAEEVEKSLNIRYNSQSIRQAKQSLGASGSFFFFSADHRLVVKTIAQEQKQALLQLLPHYFVHIRDYPNTFLSKTYGLFTIQVAGLSKICFTVLQNSFSTLEELNVKYRKYDMKGSTVCRDAKGGSVLKDINYFNSNECFLVVEAEVKRQLMRQMAEDVGMLCRHNIMDYSLLLGVGNCSRVAENRLWKCVRDKAHDRVYSLSLIDYLQKFNFGKRMELYFKTAFNLGGDISSIHSDAYSSRFLTFLDRIVVPLNQK